MDKKDEVGSWSNGKINEISESVHAPKVLQTLFAFQIDVYRWWKSGNEAVRFKEPSEACGQTWKIMKWQKQWQTVMVWLFNIYKFEWNIVFFKQLKVLRIFVFENFSVIAIFDPNFWHRNNMHWNFFTATTHFRVWCHHWTFITSCQ